LEELQQVWRNQTQIASWDSPIYAEFFAVVREINQKLSPDHQLHVLGGDPPIDWSTIQTIADYMSFAGGEHRDESLASVLRNQVIKNHEKALVIYGSAHFRAVEESAPGKVFVVNAQGGSGPGYEAFEKALHSRERPVLLSLRGTPAASFPANRLSWGARRFVGGKEVPLFAPGVTLGDLADACVYFGQVADADPEPDPAIYRGSPYGAEIARRRQILDTKR
jgi:hypothetical protein